MLIKEKRIPLIFVSSKTSDEIEYLHKIMAMDPMPYIFENGSAIQVPGSYFPDYPQKRIINFGIPYNEIVKFVKDISIRYGYNIKGYHNISDNELESLTGLSGERLERSKNRLYSLPLLKNEETERILATAIVGKRLKLLHGGRFLHLLADTDKGKAIKVLKHQYEDDSSLTVGLGDSSNDLEMLKSVDIPVLIRKHDGSCDQSVQVPNMRVSRLSGPCGWNECIIEIIKGERISYG